MNRKYRRKNIFKFGLLYGAIAIVLTGCRSCWPMCIQKHCLYNNRLSETLSQISDGLRHFKIVFFTIFTMAETQTQGFGYFSFKSPSYSPQASQIPNNQVSVSLFWHKQVLQQCKNTPFPQSKRRIPNLIPIYIVNAYFAELLTCFIQVNSSSKS